MIKEFSFSNFRNLEKSKDLIMANEDKIELVDNRNILDCIYLTTLDNLNYLLDYFNKVDYGCTTESLKKLFNRTDEKELYFISKLNNRDLVRVDLKFCLENMETFYLDDFNKSRVVSSEKESKYTLIFNYNRDNKTTEVKVEFSMKDGRAYRMVVKPDGVNYLNRKNRFHTDMRYIDYRLFTMADTISGLEEIKNYIPKKDLFKDVLLSISDGEIEDLVFINKEIMVYIKDSDIAQSLTTISFLNRVKIMLAEAMVSEAKICCINIPFMEPLYELIKDTIVAIRAKFNIGLNTQFFINKY